MIAKTGAFSKGRNHTKSQSCIPLMLLRLHNNALPLTCKYARLSGIRYDYGHKLWLSKITETLTRLPGPLHHGYPGTRWNVKTIQNSIAKFVVQTYIVIIGQDETDRTAYYL